MIKVNTSSCFCKLPIILSVFKFETKLHMIRIRFGTFSYDRVTRLLKANFVDKLSHFGGTAGLFTGFSFISVFECLTFSVSLLLMFFHFLTNKDMKRNIVEVEEYKEKGNEKTNGQEIQELEKELLACKNKLERLEKNMDVLEKKFEGLNEKNCQF